MLTKKSSEFQNDERMIERTGGSGYARFNPQKLIKDLILECPAIY
jgi:hypothetical protein